MPKLFFFGCKYYEYWILNFFLQVLKIFEQKIKKSIESGVPRKRIEYAIFSATEIESILETHSCHRSCSCVMQSPGERSASRCTSMCQLAHVWSIDRRFKIFYMFPSLPFSLLIFLLSYFFFIFLLGFSLLMKNRKISPHLPSYLQIMHLLPINWRLLKWRMTNRTNDRDWMFELLPSIFIFTQSGH
jgi:hypothetical protein